MGMPERIRGVEYASPKQAGMALNVATSTVHSGLRQGKPDSIGTGPKRQNPRPVQIGTFSAPSIREAERILGYSHTTIIRHLNAGNVEWFERVSKGG